MDMMEPLLVRGHVSVLLRRHKGGPYSIVQIIATHNIIMKDYLLLIYTYVHSLQYRHLRMDLITT